jgi:hypothetical protein
LPDGLWRLRNWYVIHEQRETSLMRERSSPLATGRTTFVNTLCGKSVLTHKDADDVNDASAEEGVKIKPITVGMSIQIPSGGFVTRPQLTLRQSLSLTRREPVFP